MEEGASQGCPLSPLFASFVVARLLEPIDGLLRERAAARLDNGDTGDDGGRRKKICRWGIQAPIHHTFIGNFKHVASLRSLVLSTGLPTKDVTSATIQNFSNLMSLNVFWSKSKV